MLEGAVVLGFLVALVAVVMGLITQQHLWLLVLAVQILVVVVEVVEIQLLREPLVALALSSFVTPIHIQQQRQPQAHPQLRWLVVTVFTNGLAQGVSHSDGTLCTT
jgi:hypothetical protein